MRGQIGGESEVREEGDLLWVDVLRTSGVVDVGSEKITKFQWGRNSKQ